MPTLSDQIPEDWRTPLRAAIDAPSFAELDRFVAAERRSETVYPPADRTFAALACTPFAAVRAVIIGQDPYHGPGQAHGLCFSVPPGIRKPPSLRNIFKELHDDTGAPIPESGSLVHWAKQGVLLLNTVLTVRAGEPRSHGGHGWEQFTDAIIRAVDARPVPTVFVLWGAPARKKRNCIDTDRHGLITGAHPSPLSAYRGFFGSRPFSRCNEALEARGHAPIAW